MEHPNEISILHKIMDIAAEYGIEFRRTPDVCWLGTDREEDNEYVITVYYDSGSWVFRVTDNGFLKSNIKEQLFSTKKEAVKKERIKRELNSRYTSFFDFYREVIDEIQKQDWASKFVGYYVEEAKTGLYTHVLFLDRTNTQCFTIQSPIELNNPDCPRLVVESFNYEYLWAKKIRTKEETEWLLSYEKNIVSKETNHETSI